MKYTSAIITLSDTRAAGMGKDLSKEVIEEILNAFDFEVAFYTLLPDDFEKLKDELLRLSEKNINLIVTTGGTGLSVRDVTPEATKAVIEREVPGVMEAMRSNSIKYTKRAMLTRGVCGIKNKSVIINLPGSPKACKESLEYVIDTLTHGIDSLLGTVSDCGRK